MPRWWKRLQLGVWRTAQDDRDLDDEVRFHLAEEERLRVERGTAPEHAASAVRRDFGNVLRVKEVTRRMRTWIWLESLVQDVRYGGRILRRNRLFTLFSVLSLALGIGATSAIYSLFNAIVERTLPVREPDRLVTFSFAMGGGSANNFMPYPHFAAMRDSSRTLEGIFAWTGIPRVSLGLQGQRDIVAAQMVTGGYHSTLGLQPAAGRLLTPDDDRPGQATSAVISHGYWQRRFAGGANAIGAAITLNEKPFTIVGVEPQGFAGVNVGSPPDVTIPLHAREAFGGNAAILTDAFATWIEIMGRVRADVPIDQARQELTAIYAQVNTSEALAAPSNAFAQRAAREAHLNVEPGARGGQSVLRSGYQRWLRLLLLMLGAVVFLASLNVATLLLARAEARAGEIGTRLAIGAGRGRIIRQLMTESLVIAFSGGALGLLFAGWAGPVLLRIATSRTGARIDLTLGWRVIGFTLLVSLATCVLFGLMPALRATAKRGTSPREVGGPRRRLLERLLVVAQTAVSLVLLVFAALFVRSLQSLWAQDPGYDRTNVVMFSIDAKLAGKDNADTVAVYSILLRELESVPAVQAVSASAVAPVSLDSYFIDTVTKAGRNLYEGDRRIRVAFNFLAPRYFETLSIPLVSGRDFSAQDGPDTPKVAIISQKLAARFAGDPVGQSITGSFGTCEVIGVARDNRYAGVSDDPRDVVYLPMFQAKQIRYAPTFEIKHAGPPSAVLRTVTDVVARIDPALTIFRPNTLTAYTQDSLSRERLVALLSSYLGGFALLLACIGLYGLMSYTVTERTPELGLRMALGSAPSGIQWMVLRDSAVTMFSGLVAGLLAAWILAGLVTLQLFQIEQRDPLSLAAASAVLLIVAAFAAYLPARRAARINPITALRWD